MNINALHEYSRFSAFVDKIKGELEFIPCMRRYPFGTLLFGQTRVQILITGLVVVV